MLIGIASSFARSVAEETPATLEPPRAFLAPLRVPLAAPASALVAADFNNDGVVDVVVGDGARDDCPFLGPCQRKKLLFYAGTGLGTLGSPRASRDNGTAVRRLAVGDLDSDGNLDLGVVPVSALFDYVYSGLGDGRGGFDRGGPVGGSAVGTGPLVLGDVNEDGHPDMIVGIGYGVSVYLGYGTGDHDNYYTGVSPSAMALADFDQDGHLDLAQIDGGLAVSYGFGRGTFPSAATVPAGGNVADLVVDDFNLDGDPDIAVTNQSPSRATIVLGNGSRVFSAPRSTTLAGTAGSLASGDFDGDGVPDVVVVTTNPDQVSLLLGDGSGGLSEPISSPVGTRPTRVATGDLDRDGRLDAIVANAGSSDLSLLLNARSGVRVIPSHGGNTGAVTVKILGVPAEDVTEVLLRRTGYGDIQGNRMSPLAGGELQITFDLSGVAAGIWDLVVDQGNGATQIWAGAFTVDAGGRADVWLDLVGRDLIRPGRAQRYALFVGNKGNVDAAVVPTWIAGIPLGGNVVITSQLLPPPDVPPPDSVDWTQFPVIVASEAGLLVPLVVSRLAPGETAQIDFTVEVPVDTQPFTLVARAAQPFFQSPINPAVLECFSEVVRAIPFEIGCALEAWNQVTIAWFDRLFGSELYSSQQALAEVILACASNIPLDDVAKLAVDAVDGMLGEAQAVPACVRAFPPAAQSTVMPAAVVRFPITPVTAIDPNEKRGPTGRDSQAFISGQEPLRYAILFENLETATAPAQEVVISDSLDPAFFDLATFALGPITFGTRIVQPPVGAMRFETEVNLSPENNLLVHVTAGLDISTGNVSWRFASLDPLTRQPPEDPLTGFLPPNASPPEGDGMVTFTVSALAGTATGTVIHNEASIQFDHNEAIDTPSWMNTIDGDPPVTRLGPLPAQQSDTSFDIEWSGSDSGVGIASYSLLVSVDGAPFTPAIQDTEDTRATFDGEAGRIYGFVVLGTDRVGNRERKTLQAEVTTQTPGPTTTTLPTSTTLALVSTTTLNVGTTTTSTLPDSPCVTASCLARSALSDEACTNVTVPTPITKSLENAVMAAEQAALAGAKQRGKLQKKIRQSLARAYRRAKRYSRGKRPKLDPECAAAIENAIARARGALAAGQF